MRYLTFTVAKEYENEKAMSFLRGHCSFSVNLIKKLKLTKNGITRNGELLRTIDTLHEGDIVKVSVPNNEKTCEPSDIPIDIVFEDEDLIVLNKPPFMPVHPSRGHKNQTLANACAAHFSKSGHYDAFRAVNRLDRDTSGLVVAAKNTYAAAVLCGKTEKEYIAIVKGKIKSDITIDKPIRIKKGFGITREVGEGGKDAVTHVHVIKHFKGHTLISLKLETGRTHQIRVHMASISHPLAGDNMYGGSRDMIKRHALHCAKLSFVHPITKENLEFFASLPEDMEWEE